MLRFVVRADEKLTAFLELEAAIRSVCRTAAALAFSTTSSDCTLSLPSGEQKSTIRRVNYWNIIADTLDSLNKARLWNSRNLSPPDKDAH